jgi:undecaprenyl-diphosphatase
MSPDNLILAWFHMDLASTLADVLFNWFSNRYLFSTPILLSLLAYSYIKQGRQGVIWWFSLIFVIALGDMLGNILKELFSEVRPCAIAHTFQAVRENVVCGDSAKGMPSNHAINFFTATLFVMLTRPQWRSWHGFLLICSILASLSRIYLAKHFPSQVIAGTFIGIYVGTISALLYHYRSWFNSLLNSMMPILRKEP